MTTLVPDYYKVFKCIADKCRHTCCEGWDICIDDNSLDRYKKDNLRFISEENTPHFILDEQQRCPYLMSDGLCRLIVDKGEDYLCQICKDHPRFRNYWTGITEIGLGLVCEEAARIILTCHRPMTLVPIEGQLDISLLPDDERYLWDVRDNLLKEASQIEDSMTARLCEYFIYRHIPDALYDDNLDGRIKFVTYCVNNVVSLWDKSDDQSDDALILIARKFSYDTEYNLEKKEQILSDLS